MKLTQRRAEILLMCLISARATSFMFSKTCLIAMTVYSLISVRFLTAAALLFAIFNKKILKGATRYNALCG